MDFSLSTEQNEIKEMTLKFAKNELIPVAAKYDEEEIFPQKNLKKPGNLDLSIPAFQLSLEELDFLPWTRS